MDDVSVNAVAIPEEGSSKWAKFLAFAGPGVLASIAYLDPGNFVADLDLGCLTGYRLAWGLLYASLLSFAFQLLAARLGVVSGRSLAVLCRESFPAWVVRLLWVGVEMAIISADVQAVIGSAIGLHLLLGVPLWAGCLITAVDTFFVLLVFSAGVRMLETIFLALIGVMAVCFLVQAIASEPHVGHLVEGLVVPALDGSEDVQLVAAMLGATIMTHNLFLHSQLVQTRVIDRNNPSKIEDALHFFSLEFALCMGVALVINVAIIVVFAAQFFPSPSVGLEQAGDALRGALGDYARVLWAVGILAAGQASTMTGTYAGQFVMEGFLNIQIAPWLRALFTRSIALVPAMFVSTFYTAKDLNELDSAVNILQAFILPLAIVPLLRFLAAPHIMGEFALSSTAFILWGVIGTAIVSANVTTVLSFLPSASAVEVVLAVSGILLYCVFLYFVVRAPLQHSDAEEKRSLVGKNPI